MLPERPGVSWIATSGQKLALNYIIVNVKRRRKAFLTVCEYENHTRYDFVVKRSLFDFYAGFSELLIKRLNGFRRIALIAPSISTFDRSRRVDLPATPTQ